MGDLSTPALIETPQQLSTLKTYLEFSNTKNSNYTWPLGLWKDNLHVSLIRRKMGSNLNVSQVEADMLRGFIRSRIGCRSRQ